MESAGDQTDRKGVDGPMIVNAFLVCRDARIHDDGIVDLTGAGVQHITVKSPTPGRPFDLPMTAVLMAQHQPTDVEYPTLSFTMWSATAGESATTSALLSGWRDGVGGTRFVHELIPLKYRISQSGTYLLTAHSDDGNDLATAIAVNPFHVTVT